MMNITYSDKIGIVTACVDDGNITFCDGFAYFTSNGEDCKVDVNNIHGVFMEVEQ